MTELQFMHGMAEIEPDVQLHYVQMGSGDRTMMLIHGYPETWFEWRHVMPLFAAAGFRVIAVDYRGAGNSSKPERGYDKQTMARDLHTLLTERLSIKAPIALIGHDIGMTVAVAYAAQFPAGVHKLVLVDAILPGTATFEQFITTGKLGKSNIAHFFWHNSRNSMCEALTAGRERIYVQDFFDRIAFNLGAFEPEVIERYAEQYAAPGGMRAGFEVYRAFDQDGEDNRAWLGTQGRLKMPTLFLAGAESFLGTMPEAIANEIADGGSTALVSGSGHYPPEENPEEFATTVLRFLTE